jgi:CubicO group peptidase (beta-lactamase class C family)
MRIKEFQFFLYGTFLLLFIAACGAEPESADLSINIQPEETYWADSILGNLTEQQKYFQHLIMEVPSSYQHVTDSLVGWIITNQPGGIHFLDWNEDSIQQIKRCLDTHAIVQPLFFSNYFDAIKAKPYPFWEVNTKNRDPKFTQFFEKGGHRLLNFELPIKRTKENKAWLDTLETVQGIIPVVANFDDRHAERDLDEFLQTIRTFNHGVLLQLSAFDSISFEKYRALSDFSGLFIARTKEQWINQQLKQGVDFVFKRVDSPETYSGWNPTESEKEIFNESTRRILMRKSKSSTTPVNPRQELNHIRLNMQANATALMHNKNKLVPFKSKFTLYTNQNFTLSAKLRTECGVSLVKKDFTKPEIEKILKSKGDKVLLLSDTCDQQILKSIAENPDQSKTLIAFSNVEYYTDLQTCPNLIFYPSMLDFDPELFVQQLTSRLSLTADFFSGDSLVPCKRVEKKVLARTSPSFVGLDADTLSRIAYLMNSCMSNKAFPGGQVLIAKDGCIIYDRVFGKHTYAGNQLVTENSMYDLASLTKVVSTTLVGMKLYEMGIYELDDSLEKYLPDTLKQHLKYPSTIRHITFQELFTHTSGMPSGFPIIKYMRYTGPEVGRYDRFFCDIKDSCYETEVAENFYLEKEQQDSMWLRLNQIFLDPSKDYNYSDVNMNTLYFFFKSFIEKSPEKFGFTQTRKQLKDKNLYEEFLYNTFYKPLGMNHTRYRPLRFFSRDLIVPTENDTYWRKQLLHGYVHDPNAALHGGIAGNAGIFSTTHDLVILFQMWLNKGVYNGQRYLKAETVDKFTARQENCFRGLGFNKPSMGSTSFGMSENASLSTYGHTGFTGTCFWIDPAYDLIYIYLSNAVHPSVNNKTYEYGIRKKVHQCAYDAMMVENF